MAMIAQPVAVAVKTIKPGVWQTNWTDCCAEPGGCSRCCVVSCCGPCTFGRIVKELPPGRCNVCCAGNECGACAGYAAIGGVAYAAGYAGIIFGGIGPVVVTPIAGVLLACMNYPVRRALKAHYGITQDPGTCPDCGVVTFCELCMLCQQIREVELRAPVAVMMMAGPAVVMAPQPVVMAQPQVVV